MRKAICRLAGPATVMLASLAGSSVNATPITINNPSFEAVQIPPGDSSNPANVPGWTHGGTIGDALLWHVGYSDSGGVVTTAGDGLQFVTLGGGTGPTLGSGSWSQAIGGFVIGASYQLDFMIAPECGPNFNLPTCRTQSVTASIQQGAPVSQLFTATNNVGSYWQSWQPESLTFTADSTNVVLTFSATVTNDVGLDNVRITEVTAPNATVPEPGSLLLLGSGLILARRRRR